MALGDSGVKQGKLFDMPKLKEGERVRVVEREPTTQDRQNSSYFAHMAGLTGTVQNIYENGQVAVKIDPDMLLREVREVHDTAVQRMRDKFANSVSEEQRKLLSKEELEFSANYVLLVQAEDLELIKD